MMKVTNNGLVSTEETNSNFSEIDFKNQISQNEKRPRVSNLFLQADGQDDENYVSTTEDCVLSSQRVLCNQNDTNIPNVTPIHSRLSFK